MTKPTSKESLLGLTESEQVLPTGTLLHLSVKEIKPSVNNPRHLFDAPQLAALKQNIKQHGVLVPITVYRVKSQTKYSILDGERRFRCCRELEDAGHEIKIPANIVATPTKVAGLLYMFSIHNFRESWELMPTALGLKSVMEALSATDNEQLTKLTGMSGIQIDRCQTLLSFPEKYQNMSLDSDPKTRIPSNFWIELNPVLNLCEHECKALVKRHGRDGITDLLVAKYRAKKIKSVIHFRRIIEAYEVAVEAKQDVLKRLVDFISDVDMETRQAFDEFVVDNRRIQTALETCDTFIRDIDKQKLDFTVDKRDELAAAFVRVRDYATSLIAKLEGSDAPVEDDDEE